MAVHSVSKYSRQHHRCGLFACVCVSMGLSHTTKGGKHRERESLGKNTLPQQQKKIKNEQLQNTNKKLKLMCDAKAPTCWQDHIFFFLCTSLSEQWSNTEYYIFCSPLLWCYQMAFWVERVFLSGLIKNNTCVWMTQEQVWSDGNRYRPV